MPEDPEAAFEWDRRGAPQVRHPHVFLGLARVILRDRFPDVLETLAGYGIQPPPPGTGPDNMMDEETRKVIEADDDLRMLPCRRTTFEWVMRKTVLAEAGVEFLVGKGVAGLDIKEGLDGLPQVTAVRLEDGTVLPADIAVVATGRRGDVPAWAAEHGVEIPETTSDTEVVYISRWYRSPSEEWFGFRGAFGAGIGCGVIGADHGTFSITAVVDRYDKELRAHLNDSARFEATMRLLPELEDVFEADGTPIQPVHTMTGLINRTRTFTRDDGMPLIVGLAAVGDSHTCTNPAYGRGMSLALRQATFLADAIAKSDDLAEAGREYEAASIEHVVPWYHFSVMTDQMRASANKKAAERRAARKEAEKNGEIAPDSKKDSSDSLPVGGGGDFASLFMSAAGNPELIRKVMRVMNLLDPPSELMPMIMEAQAAGPPKEPPTDGPWAIDTSIKRPRRADLLAAGV
jgi:2-polyprenyl-6-methoxyphenol hydroxylase-like FAD-dependent oxidoreductase